MQQRGQATLFIILGIIIASIIALTVLYKQQVILAEWQKSRAEAEAKLPVEKEILQLLQNCIDEKAQEAVTMAGMQGGYIDVPPDKLPQGPNNQFSNSLLITGSMSVPYWFYETANGLQKMQIPEDAILEEQLSRQLEKEAAVCAPEVASRYDISASEDKISVTTSIDDERVLFTVDYPVTIESSTIKITTGKMTSTVNAPLGRLMSYGKQMAQSEDPFLEDKTIDMLVLYDELPFTGTELTCSTKLWTKPKVLEDFRKIASENIQNVRIAGSTNEVKTKYFNWDIIKNSNLKANFMYSPNWPVQMDIQPSEGELLKGDSLNEQVGNEAAAFLNSMFCITNYHFIYSIKYPVLVTLTDAKTGYTLQYATMVIIKNNQPRENKATLDNFEEEAEVCKDKSATATVYAMKPEGAALNPISDAEIKYKCANTVCSIGKTDNDGKLTANFPQCYNGYVLASKEGLLDEKEQFSTNKENEITLLMDPMHTIQFEIKVMDNGAERSVREDEQAIVQLTEADKGYVTSVSQEQSTVKIVPGSYKMKTYLTQQAGAFQVQIPKQEVEHCAKVPEGILGFLGFTTTKCAKTEIPATTLPNVIKGGSTGEWQLSRDELDGANKITFYIPAYKTPGSYDELNSIYSKIQTAEGTAPSLE